MILDFLAEKWGITFQDRTTHQFASGERAQLIKPMLSMNYSGVVVKELIDYFHDDFLVICDDADLPLGRIRLRAKGSSGGHKGLESIIEEIGSEDFKRLRIGIGRPESGELTDYVLSPFTDPELKVLSVVIDRVLTGIEILLDQGLLIAQQFLNRE